MPGRQIVSYSYKRMPIEAFGATAGIEPQYDDKGNLIGIKYNIKSGLLGLAGLSFYRGGGIRKFIELYTKFKQIPSGVPISNPEGRISLGAISKEIRAVIGSDTELVSLTRRALKHAAEKPESFPTELVSRIPEILIKPTEIRKSAGEGRYLFILKSAHKNAKGTMMPGVSVVEVSLDKKTNTLVMVFPSNDGYLSKFGLLWKTASLSSEAELPSAYPLRDAGSRAAFSALKGDQISNERIPIIRTPRTFCQYP